MTPEMMKMCRASRKKRTRKGEFRKELQDAFRCYAHKGPVDIPSVQDKVYGAFEKIKSYFTSDEYQAILMEHGHAIHVGEGRAAFDREIKKAYTRLGIDTSGRPLWKRK